MILVNAWSQSNHCPYVSVNTWGGEEIIYSIAILYMAMLYRHQISIYFLIAYMERFKNNKLKCFFNPLDGAVFSGEVRGHEWYEVHQNKDVEVAKRKK